MASRGEKVRSLLLQKDTPMSDLGDVIKEFLIESRENLDQLDRDLVTLERDPANKGVLGSVFRTIHTIKGTCGFFDFVKLGAVTHSGESLLSRLRDGTLLITPEITSGLLAMVDAVRRMLASIESHGREGAEDYTALVERLDRLKDGPGRALDPTEGHQVDSTSPDQPNSGAQNEARPVFADDTSIRVDVVLLDKLMNLVGELVLARNQLLQFTGALTDSAILGAAQHLNLITTELQEGVMKTRMQPIAHIWNKLPRVTRDLALACGKQVSLTMEGKETELDKSIIESIKDPLTHLLRNAIDHGIETQDVRRQRGKPAEGQVHLRAYHEGGQVNIEMSDDGAGIDPRRIQHKAIECGLIQREQAARMSEREVLQLIFLPGFSTADTVTSVSGRGVGMDVVKTNIERLGGTLDIQSHVGVGTTVKVKIPLTLAIIPALLVTAGGDRYAIPQVSLLELVRLDSPQALRGIEQIHGAPVYRLRGKLLPLVYLHRELRVEARASARDDGAINIVVLQAADRTFGLIVDEISDTEEIVVKPLGMQLQGIPIYAGATILGDGRVALILDVLGLAQAASVVSEVRERTLPERSDRGGNVTGQCQAVLVVGVGSGRRLAVPLSQVARLEDIPRSAVEETAGRPAVQYRGQIVPLVSASELLPGAAGGQASFEDPVHVVVCSGPERTIGIVVEHIVDIIETQLVIDASTRSPGILGTAILQQRLTDVLHVPEILKRAGLLLGEPAELVETKPARA
jgi:two-component system chemotaxis sensor kinase CheA